MQTFSLISVCVLALALPGAAQSSLVWNQNVNGYTTVPSSQWTQPSAFDVESADDFDFDGDVARVIVNGDYSFQSPPPAGIDGVWVRFYAWVDGAPGALQQEEFVAEGDPRFLHTATPTDLDVTLAQPFTATGKHFVSVQLVTPSAQAWQWWSASNGSPAMTRLASAYRRDRGAGGGWTLLETVLGDEIDLAFDLWGSDGTQPNDPVDPCGPWEQLPVPPLPSNYSTTVLRDLVVVDHDDVWAVGDPSVEVQFLNFEFKNLALHWDGRRWSEVPTPNPSVFPAPYGSTGLQAIDALRSDFVWAVGNQETRDGFGFIIDQPLVLRWDGGSWQQVAVPNTNYDTYTYGVKLLADDDAWIVGGGGTPCGGGLAIHYDGSAFRVTPTPGPCSGLAGGTPGFDLVDVDGVASDDVWGVGGGSDGDFSGTTYVLHWDGSSWSYVSAPAPGFARRLFDVHALASDDVWAVGQYEELVGGVVQYRAWAIHWDGSSWTLHDGANASIGSLSVHAFAEDDVYTAGGQIHHWDGTTWSLADDLDQLSGAVIGASIAGLDAIAPCHLWAAGRQFVAGQIVPFTARHVGDVYWRVRPRACASLPGVPNGLTLLDPPQLGGSFAVAIGDPQSRTGFTPNGTQTVWLLGSVPASSSACSLVVPGFGVAGAPGVVLVDVLGGPSLTTSATTWGGPGNPAVHRLAVPLDIAFLGATIATQGVLADLTAPSPIALTDALDATLGW